MIPTPLDEIDYAVLQGLIGRLRESKTLEFKRELPKAEKEAKLKFLKGVTALANTSGGDFVIGVQEKAGAAVLVEGIEIRDPDAFKLTLESWLSTLVDPILPQVDIREVPCPGNRWAFVIRVPRSWIGPHRVAVDNHFYVRTSASTKPLEVPELRAAFGLRLHGTERIEAFRRERLAKIVAGETPVPLQDGPCAVLHMAPLPSFANRDLIDVVARMKNGTHMPVPFRGRGSQALVNLHGVCNHTNQGTGAAVGYGQLFRSGATESVSLASEDQDGPYWSGVEFANCLVAAVRYALQLQAAYDLPFPTFAMLSLCRAERLRWRIESGAGIGYQDAPPTDQAIIAFPEVLIENAAANVPTLLRPLLDMVWNTYGLLACPLFDGAGEWIGA